MFVFSRCGRKLSFGAGETTIFNLIGRIYDPTAGRLIYRGRDITGLPAHAVAGLGIARTLQNIELFERATVLQNLLLGQHRRSSVLGDILFLPGVRRHERACRAKAEEVIGVLDLQHRRDSTIMNLPYGVRKVVELGRALCAEPELLLLDEPSSGLNVEETEDMAFWIDDIKNGLGVTVVMVEHDMSLVGEVSDRVLALNDGRALVLGTPAEIRTDPDVVRAYLGG